MSFVWSVLLASSPSGKLVQIEYALQAVAAGAPSVGIKAKNGVVLAVEKKQKSVLYDESSICKVCVRVFYCGLSLPNGSVYEIGDPFQPLIFRLWK